MGKFGTWLSSGFGTGLGGILGGPVGALAGNVIGNWIGRSMQKKENARARRYNSPKSQMARYAAAGLNPNLVYTQGSAGSYGQTIDYTSGRDYGSSYVGASQSEAQTELARSKREESVSKRQVLEAQKEVLEANPYLNSEYVKSLVTSMSATAEIKDQERRFLRSGQSLNFDATDPGVWETGFLKMQRELDLLGQKYNLNKADLKMKAEIFQGKDFENDLKKIQLDWMKSGEITPQHIYQGIMMILSKMM